MTYLQAGYLAGYIRNHAGDVVKVGAVEMVGEPTPWTEPTYYLNIVHQASGRLIAVKSLEHFKSLEPDLRNPPPTLQPPARTVDKN